MALAVAPAAGDGKSCGGCCTVPVDAAVVHQLDLGWSQWTAAVMQ